jgi:hypothetical protein
MDAASMISLQVIRNLLLVCIVIIHPPMDGMDWSNLLQTRARGGRHVVLGPTQGRYLNDNKKTCTRLPFLASQLERLHARSRRICGPQITPGWETLESTTAKYLVFTWTRNLLYQTDSYYQCENMLQKVYINLSYNMEKVEFGRLILVYIYVVWF